MFAYPPECKKELYYWHYYRTIHYANRIVLKEENGMT
jgi:hypothetical protein